MFKMKYKLEQWQVKEMLKGWRWERAKGKGKVGFEEKQGFEEAGLLVSLQGPVSSCAKALWPGEPNSASWGKEEYTTVE